jgi:hypothetical protein
LKGEHKTTMENTTIDNTYIGFEVLTSDIKRSSVNRVLSGKRNTVFNKGFIEAVSKAIENNNTTIFISWDKILSAVSPDYIKTKTYKDSKTYPQILHNLMDKLGYESTKVIKYYTNCITSDDVEHGQGIALHLENKRLKA